MYSFLEVRIGGNRPLLASRLAGGRNTPFLEGGRGRKSCIPRPRCSCALCLWCGLPLALGMGTGSEPRRPLGITIVGGLIVSQMLTLFTRPVVYIYIDRVRLWLKSPRPRLHGDSDQIDLRTAP